MNLPTAPGSGPATPHFAVVLTLLWLAGAAMRIPLLVVPPVIPLIHDDLTMTETQVGALMGMPLIMFALAAVPGSLLIARLGVMRVVVAGLLITALASAARSAALDVWTLYAATIVMGLGIAILQPAMPTLVRAWAPRRMWLANAAYTNGMVIGVTLASALTIPVVLPLLGGSWRRALVAWAAPGLIATLAYIVAPLRAPAAPTPSGAAARWWPDWNSPLIWLLGLTLGANNGLFYAINAFVPDYLNSIGRGDMIAMTLGWLNGSQLAASLFLLAMPESQQRRSWPFTIFGPLTVLAMVGVLLGQGYWIVVSAAVLGFAASVTFVVTFGLPAMLSAAADVPRTAGGMFTISYTTAVIVPILCGAFWDITGIPWTSFVPIGLCSVALTIFGAVLTLRKAHD